MRLLGVLAVVCLSLGLAPAASAHAVLVSSDPADGATLAVGPSAVSLTFDDAIGNPSVITVTGPNGRVDLDNTTIADKVVSVGVKIPGTPAQYTVAYRVISDDGHPVTGARHFTVAPPQAGAPAPSAAVPAKKSSHLATYLGAAGVIVVALAISLVALRRRG